MYVPVQLQRKQEIAVAAASATGGWSLQYLPAECTDSCEVVFAAVSSNGEALQYASAALLNDRKVVLAAVAQNPVSLRHASQTLRADKEVVMLAVRQNGLTLEYADESLQHDVEIVSAAVCQSGLALQCASEELRSDHNIVLAAAANDLRALQYASEALLLDACLVDTVVDRHQKTCCSKALLLKVALLSGRSCLVVIEADEPLLRFEPHKQVLLEKCAPRLGLELEQVAAAKLILGSTEIPDDLRVGIFDWPGLEIGRVNELHLILQPRFKSPDEAVAAP
mmetsp:Transcript_29919/g.69602  ORF Transcript_29919/g.69602 Transcript_29919/m.69602 type:complete len:281 (+) Transcript_29919:233-1075(+)